MITFTYPRHRNLTISFAVAVLAMAIGLYAYGFGLQGFLTALWSVLGTAGLTLAVFYVRLLKA
jgi:hypothetical protein